MREQDLTGTVCTEPLGGDGERPARVIEVLDPYTVLIDRGRNTGLDMGETYEVYRLNESREPDSPTEIVKGIGEVVAVYKKTAALRSITPAFIVERRTAIPGYLGGPFPEVVGAESGEISPFEDPRVGDLVRPAKEE